MSRVVGHISARDSSYHIGEIAKLVAGVWFLSVGGLLCSHEVEFVESSDGYVQNG